MRTNGGYDDGYTSCKCFWGVTPGSLLPLLATLVDSFRGLKALDAGCGEGKNAAFLARLGVSVRAIDISAAAIRNGKSTFGALPTISWEIGDIRDATLLSCTYDIVVCYGLLHCLGQHKEVRSVVSSLQHATRPGGYHVVCTFNDRCHDLTAHPGFEPLLLPHESYISLYDDWQKMAISDEDIWERHPHNQVLHNHSLTRFIARRTA